MSSGQRVWGLLRSVLSVTLAITIGIVGGGILMSATGYDAPKAYVALYQGSFGDLFSFATTVNIATPIILTALTFAIGFRSGLFNIGAEGQVYVGALASVAAGFVILPSGLHLLFAAIVAMLAGAAWSLPAAFLKVTRGVHEVISTIMLNWIALNLGFFVAIRLLVNPANAERTLTVAPGARFSLLVAGSELTSAIFASLLFASATYGLLWHTVVGYELRGIGLNPEAARYGGISYRRTTVLSFALGGGAAGLAGAISVLGRDPVYALYTNLSNVVNIGFDGIAVALIGRNHPLGVIPAGLFFGALSAGARLMQIDANVPREMVTIVQGAIILAAAIPEAVSLFRRFRRRQVAG